MSATIADIAKATGYSTATVSYALRGNPQVKPETAAKVREAAARLHYQGNASARSLRLGRSNVIAVAVHDLALPFSAELAHAISVALAPRGYQVFAQQTLFTGSNEETVLRELDHQFCDGTIFCSGELKPEQMKKITGSKPLVILDPSQPTDLYDSVYTPGHDGAYDVVSHLLRTGCRHIVAMGVAYQPYERVRNLIDVSNSRLAGCMDACRDAGVAFGPDNTAVPAQWTVEGAYDATMRLLDEGRKFDAVYCLSDTVAIGVMHALHDRGIAIPDDVAVAGFDGIEAGRSAFPPLTTTAVDFDRLAATLADLLLRRIETPDAPIETRTADFTLEVRGSTH
ncbi:LacI family DNA-binding transcriptional regulator [Bifidobacterium biavatii]|uniref:Periplasmic binding protein and sugar binding domain of the LacI family protein n=1 Tax=Bifidobacterium biavatii DSM 23969 TaxID=1437608 RepID=A0A087A1L4_9BIFI|nr:LacI family DNA-binding transcriptional regulator [Bifidobacterium biavatii]KFI52664.1 periplasmic binding protein and sugar binding domain of the LacI family protein [Bifidobacterium biavatii DSM 23969]